MSRVIVVSMVAGALLIGLCAFLLNRGHRMLLAAQQGEEAARLTLSHQIVASEETRQELQASVQSLIAENDDLREAVEEARAAAPSARVTSHASLSTGTVPIRAPSSEPEGPPMPPECASNEILAPDNMGGFYCASRTNPAPPTPKACALRDGDEVRFQVDQVELQAEAGSRLVAGTAALYRGPDMLARARFQSALSSTGELQAPTPPRWGVEVGGLCHGEGCGPGVGVLLPPWSVLGLRLESRVDGLLGPRPAVAAWLGVRW